MNLQSLSRNLPFRRVLGSRPAFTRKTELHRLRAENARYKTLVNSAPIGHFTLDANMRIVEANPAAISYLAIKDGELANESLLSYFCADSKDLVKNSLDELYHGEHRSATATVCIQNRLLPVALHLTALHAAIDEPHSYHVAMVDLTEHKATEQNLRIARDGLQHIAYHDPLTRLPNRSGFKNQLQKAINTSGNKKVALILLDLDNFKQVNDPLGHHAGDKLLREVAERLLSIVKNIDTVGRLGGDEFAIVLKDIDSVSQVSAIADKINNALAHRYTSVSQDIRLAASIGISVYPVHSDNAKELICYADAAMNQAKSRGRNRTQLYTTELNDTLIKRFELERDIRNALQKSQFELYYQPQYDLRTSSVTGYEVLLRWNHPQRGIVSPESFIEVAEESGLIEPLGEWILTESCKKLALLRRTDRNLKLSVNVSAKQFSKGDLREKIADTLKTYDLPAESLELELTESALFENVEQSVSMLHSLRDEGVALAIDDFGTGYSSFSRLQKLPVTRVKIDRSFVHDIPTNQSNCSIVSAIISVAHVLGIEVVAEGVESHKQALFLSEAGCDVLQGYYVGRPQAFDNIGKKAKLKNANREPVAA